MKELGNWSATRGSFCIISRMTAAALLGLCFCLKANCHPVNSSLFFVAQALDVCWDLDISLGHGRIDVRHDDEQCGDLYTGRLRLGGELKQSKGGSKERALLSGACATKCSVVQAFLP